MFIASLILGILGLVMGLATTTSQIESQNQNVADTNQANRDIATETNETNLQAVRETNAANVEQANLAYRRSLPINQVADLMQAGFSKHGALNKLAGGGVYSAPALQSATAQTGAPMQTNPNNVGAFSEIFQRLGNMPADFTQQKLVETQIQQAQEELNIKRAEEKRVAELHQYNVWREKYGKDTALMLDNVSSDIVQKLLDSNKTPDDFKSFDSMVHSIGADLSDGYKNLPHLARIELEQGFNDKFANARAEREQANRDDAARDSHEINLLERKIKAIDLKYYDKEKTEQLLNIMRIGQGYIQDNNIKFADLTAKDYENFVRAAGIDNEHDARALSSYVAKLLAEDELWTAEKADKYPDWFKKQFRPGLRLFMRDIGELLSKLSAFK